ALAAAQDALEVRRRSAVLGIDLEGPAQVALDLGRAGAVAGVRLGDLHEQVGCELPRRGGLGLLEVLPDDALPVLAQQAGVREPLVGVGVLGSPVEDAAEGLDRAALVEELLEEEHPLLEQEIRLALGLRGRRELDVEEVGDELQLAALAEGAARLIEG